VLLCVACLHADERQVEHCPACGAAEFAQIDKRGYVVRVPPGPMPCQGCFEEGRELRLRAYRHVIGLLVVDHVTMVAGYFCGRCRLRRFAMHMGITLVAGWWGIWALLFRNPFAIAVNLWALARPPFATDELGAMNVNDMRDAAARDESLADVYRSMPSWLEALDDGEIDIVIVETDYYAVLDVDERANEQEIKSSWRQRVKERHPDVAGASPDTSAEMALLADAYRVLGDERLRHAYDHRHEPAAFMDQVRDAPSTSTSDDDDLVGYSYGCRLCMAAFLDFDAFADHVDAAHPRADYRDALEPLEDGRPVPPPDEEGSSAGAPRWRCKVCATEFDDYDDALSHGDVAHPERTPVDPRQALEAL
jgi:hypothetical protein